MENKDITVSIIVAVYNVEHFLQKCIKSLTAQTYQNLEIILVDDGSKDNSAKLCDEWAEKDSRIVVCHQQNAGVSAARNKGISIASGEYIVFVDSDDWLDKTFVEKLLKNYHDGDLLLTGYVIDYDQASKSHHIEKVYSKEKVCCLEKGKVVSLFQAGLFSPIWNKLYERSRILEKDIRFREEMNLGEDIIFNLDYFEELSGNFRIINEPLYHYMRWGDVSLTGCYNEAYMEQQKAIYRKFLNCIGKGLINTASNTQLCCLYFDALVTGIDNLYVNRKKMSSTFYLSKMTERRKEPEFKMILEKINGKAKMIYNIRYFFVRNGFYIFDFYLRKAVKKILGLE